MYLLFGADSPLGRAFGLELRRRNAKFCSVALAEQRLADIHAAYELLRRIQPTFLINAGCSLEGQNDGVAGARKQDILYSRVLVPQVIAQACRMRNLAWAHVSSGAIFQGAKVLQHGGWTTEIDLNRPSTLRLIQSRSDRIRGFSEAEEPNHTFVCPPCNFESGAAALGEQAVRSVGNSYILRHGFLICDLRDPFCACIRPDEAPDPRGAAQQNRTNGARHCYVSATAIADFAATCLDIVERKAPMGIYHVVNPGLVDLRDVERIAENRGHLPCIPFEVPRRGFILDDSKVRKLGIELKPIAIDSICRKPETQFRMAGEASKKLSGLEIPLATPNA